MAPERRNGAVKKRKMVHYTIEHIWRLLRASLILAGTSVWLFNDSEPKLLIFLLYLAAVVVDQFHGFICNKIQSMLHYKQDFNNWD